MIHFLLYTSDTHRMLGRDDLAEILDAARRNNAANGVTGILLYAHRMVMQYLEGSHEAVEATIGKIRRDPRHYNVQVLLQDTTARRRFDRWAMGFDQIGDATALPGSIDVRKTDPLPEDDGHFDAALTMLRNFREGVALM